MVYPAKGATLLMQGENDPRVKVAEAERIFDQLKGEKKLIVFSGVSHESYVAAQPKEWREKVGSFLNGIKNSR